MSTTLSGLDLRLALSDVGLEGKQVCVQSSLSSMGPVVGGANAVVAAVCGTVQTCMMPAFTFRWVVAPPPDDRPLRNGIDYSTFRTLVVPTQPFKIEEAPVDAKMASIAREFFALEGTWRSDHPWLSYAARGEGAEALVSPHPWDAGSLPLARLIAQESYVVLLGVTLSSCAALHLSCVNAGRNNFIRWALDYDRRVRRLRAGGCSKGFDHLWPECRHLFRETRVGEAVLRVASLPALVEYGTQILIAEQEITRCSPDCLRCNDGILGGPVE